MQITITNNRDDEKCVYDMPTRYVDQSVLSPSAYKFITKKVNEFWDKDMFFSVKITRTYEESDIFGYPKH